MLSTLALDVAYHNKWQKYYIHLQSLNQETSSVPYPNLIYCCFLLKNPPVVEDVERMLLQSPHPIGRPYNSLVPRCLEQERSCWTNSSARGGTSWPGHLIESHGFHGLSHALAICFLSMTWAFGIGGGARFFVPLLQLWHKEDAEDQEWRVKMATKIPRKEKPWNTSKRRLVFGWTKPLGFALGALAHAQRGGNPSQGRGFWSLIW